MENMTMGDMRSLMTNFQDRLSGVSTFLGRGNCRFGGGLASIRYSKHAKPMFGVFDVKKHGDKE